MDINITIRNVPEHVRDELAARAALNHQSMQEFVRGELVRLASYPAVDQWIQSVRQRKQITGRKLSMKEILRHRDADRR